ncbi:MAG: aminotransferase class V-fold PLP-dependent enzyme [Clostridia bacterium]|nr:aminotransferase class V-fold PLP-dependent enzyme [Clostridia bacterium]
MYNNLIYFDNAATGFPKPENVRKAAFRAFEECGGNPGRSGHILSANASKAVYECREEVARFLNFNHPERVVFTLNATHALNFSIKGLAKKNSHIIISDLEHNSVYRPVYNLCENKENNMEFSTFKASSFSDKSVINSFNKSLRPNTKMAVITAASNICGRILPLKEISKICKDRGITLIVDASQLLGEAEFDFEEVKPDVLCSAGHKGLYGPTGTGFAVFSLEVNPKAIIQGGNGLVSELAQMGDELPEMLEAGTLNTVGICGLTEGIRFIKNYGMEKIIENCSEIEQYISNSLHSFGAKVYSDYNKKTPIILFNIPGVSSDIVSSYLNDNGICTRSGIHCASLAHKALNTGENGAVRISLGYTNTLYQAKKFIKVLKNMSLDI